MKADLKRCIRRGGFALLLALAAPAHGAEPVVIHRGNMAEPGTMDPHQAGSSWEYSILGDMLLGLTTEDVKGEPMPGAAESWTVSADGLVWTFKLRPGLVWSDGEPFKASDFVFAFRRLLDPATAAQYASIQYVIKNAEAINAGKAPVDQLGVRAIDDRTFEVTLESPTPFLTGLFTHYTAYPVPEHAYKKYGKDWVEPGKMVANGAYILAEWKPHDYVKVVKNPTFYDAKNVAIDVVYYYPTDDQTAALNRFRAGELDANIGSKGFSMTQLGWLKENMPDQARLYPMLTNEYITLNMRRPPFTDWRLRKAVSLCIDRSVLTEKVLRDGSLPAYSFIPPGIDNYRDGSAKLKFSDEPMEQRRAEAKKLLAEAGYGEDKPFTFNLLYMISIDSRRSVVAQAAMLKECGIIMRLVGNEPKVHYDMLRQADFTAAQARWQADYNDPQTFLYLLDSRSGAYNYGGYKNAEFDRLVDEGKMTLDLEKRAEILARAEQVALDDSAMVPLNSTTSKSLVGLHVKGYEDNVQNMNRTRWMRIEEH